MDTSSAMTILGGLGLFLLGIHHLTEGLKGLAGDALRRVLQTLVRGRLSAIMFGAIFTALIQSSSATVMTVIGFVSAGLVSFSQAIDGPKNVGRAHLGRWRRSPCLAHDQLIEHCVEQIADGAHRLAAEPPRFLGNWGAKR